MDVQVNFMGVLAATGVAMIVGSLWYSKVLFVTEWAKLARIDMKKGSGSPAKPIAISVVLAMVTAYVLAHVTYLSNVFFQTGYLESALTTAFWMWLGFTASRIVTHDAFEGRPMKLTAITLGCELVTLMGMGLVIGLIGL